MLVSTTRAQTTTQPAEPIPVDRRALTDTVAEIIKQHGDGLSAGVWLGGREGDAWFELDAGVARPTASAIKSFYLVELFDRFEDQLDEKPPGLDRLLKDDQHPAISHFAPAVRDEIRRELGGASVRRIGEAMMGKAKVSNAVYNAAANVTTALLGGPEGLTRAIHRRDEAFKEVAVRRYMLRDRKVPGDNEASVRALAALYQRLASGRLAGIDAPTLKAIRGVLFREENALLGRRYDKGGSLGTEPLVLVHAGWWETKRGCVVYAIMAAQPTPADSSSARTRASLKSAVDSLESHLLSAGRKALEPRS